MIDVRARKAIDLFRAVVQLPEAERAARLEAACGSDVELRTDVESLLASDAAGWSALDQPAIRSDLNTLLRATEQRLAAGFLVAGRFRIVRLLNEGGMGVVYRAEQDNPRREIALKVMRSGSQGLLQRFEREIDILGRLRHPGIAQIFDAGILHTPAGTRSFLAMELVRGEPIVVFAEKHCLDEPARLELLAKVCDAVQSAHQSGVIHRDLKPDNILVEESPQGARPRVLDFGVSALTDPSAVTLATEPGAVVGTIAYMAPEQVDGRAGTQSDVYALGVILYELLCGELPIDVRREALASAIRRIQEESPVPLSRRDVRYRGDLETILAKALRKTPSERYASADALATDIRRYLRHEPILARPASAAYVLLRFARRHRAWVGVTACALLAIVTSLVFISFALVRARSAEQRALGLARVMAERALPMLTDQVGTTAEREALAKDVHATALSLLEQSPHDPSVLSVYADSLRQLAMLEFDAANYVKMLSYCRDALDARERAIAATDREAPQLQLAKSKDLVLVGDANRACGEYATGRTYYDMAESLQERLVEQDPSAEHLSHLAWSQERLWRLALDEGRSDEVADRAERMMELCNRVVDMKPGDLTALDGLRAAYACRWLVQAQRNDQQPAAAESLNQAIAIGRRLVSADPGNRIYLRAYVSNLMCAFSLSENEQSPIQRRELIAQALPFAERFYNADPSDVTATCKLAALLGHCAELAVLEGNYDEAAQHADRLIALYEAVSSRWTTEEAHDARSTYMRAAAVYRKIGRLSNADAAAGRAQSLLIRGSSRIDTAD